MRGQYLFDLVLVSCVCAGTIVGQGFRACELVVGGGCGYDVSLAGDLASETCYWAGD